MTLEFEKLTPEIERMAHGAYQQSQQENLLLEESWRRLHEHATDWENLRTAIELAREQADEKFFRAARPIEFEEPLTAAVDPPAPPDLATLIAGDGSQILPDRHAAYLYSLINVGVIVYYHGQGRTPSATTYPFLDYPNGEELGAGLEEVDLEESFVADGAIVNIRRDLAEIQSLAQTAWQVTEDEPHPLLAILDQRLLYWPTGVAGNSEGKRVLDGWQAGMSSLRDAGALLAGYISRPGKRSVITMLQSLDILKPDFDVAKLIEPPGPLAPDDSRLFRRLLKPGQRSKVFADVSQHNNDFRRRDVDNEVCFFYMNPGRSGRGIARVDIPSSVARHRDLVDVVHGLLWDQCGIMGNYPYVLTRADEVAVVRHRDRENLDVMIANAMERYGIDRQVTPKQQGKDVARAGRTRHGL